MVFTAIRVATDIPPAHLISAVFLIAVQDGNILCARNERGWDIPGGHIKPGETPLAALAREVSEEAGATFSHAEPFAVLEAPPRQDVMLLYATRDFQIGPFSPGPEALERALIPIDEFLDRYYGPKDFLRQVILSAGYHTKAR